MVENYRLRTVEDRVCTAHELVHENLQISEVVNMHCVLWEHQGIWPQSDRTWFVGIQLQQTIFSMFTESEVWIWGTVSEWTHALSSSSKMSSMPFQYFFCKPEQKLCLSYRLLENVSHIMTATTFWLVQCMHERNLAADIFIWMQWYKPENSGHNHDF
jgi:hypothetical protein